jgi:hypothetical protein
MITTNDYALMAGRAYQSTRADINKFPTLTGWNEPLDERKVLPSGFEAGYFQRDKDIVISFAGTGPGLDVDWVANCALALGVWSDQLGEAAAYYLQIKSDSRYKESNIRIKGVRVINQRGQGHLFSQLRRSLSIQHNFLTLDFRN